MVKLNLGSGSQPIDGYENLDAKSGQEIFPLSYPDGSVDEIRASHVIEHFAHCQVADVLREWSRVLKVGGVMKIAVPDFKKISEAYLDGQDVNIQGYVMGGQTDERDYHSTIFDTEILTELFRLAGLGRIEPWVSEIQDCASLPVSLNLMGVKVEPKKLRVAAAMSVPRLGFMDQMFCWAESLPTLGIKASRYVGAFWGQCLERTMEELIEDNDYILTVDYDSIFTKKNVLDLLRLANDYPEADAIAPVQLGRGEGKLLATFIVDGKHTAYVEREVFNDTLVRAMTAHFGLTLIKTSALKDLPHPWFLGQPNKDGYWHDGKVDDDTYFWKKWAQAGKTLYVAPRVTLGHTQLMVTWPDQNLEPIHQHVSDFFAVGAPKGAWE